MWKIVLWATLLLAAAGSGWAAEIGVNRWALEISKDPFTDVEQYQSGVMFANGVRYDLVCVEGKVTGAISGYTPAAQMQFSGFSTYGSIKFRVDDGKVGHIIATKVIEIGTSNYAYLEHDNLPIARSILAGKNKLVLGVGVNTLVDTTNLRGAAEVIKATFKRCGLVLSNLF